MNQIPKTATQMGLTMRQMGLTMRQMTLSMRQMTLTMRQMTLTMHQIGLSMHQIGLSMIQMGLSMVQMSLTMLQIRWTRHQMPCPIHPVPCLGKQTGSRRYNCFGLSKDHYFRQGFPIKINTVFFEVINVLSSSFSLSATAKRGAFYKLKLELKTLDDFYRKALLF